MRLLAAVATAAAMLVLGASPAAAQNVPDGTLDPAFSGDGKATGPGFSAAETLRLSSGAILVIGGGAGQLEVRKYTDAGELDTAWGTEGGVTHAVDGLARVVAANETPGGGVAILGDAGPARGVRVKLTVAGDPDPEYSDDGLAFAVLPEGSVVRDGVKTTLLAEAADGSVVLARFCDCADALDPAFGTAGIQHDTTITGQRAYVIRDARGWFAVVGYRAGETVLTRYRPDGTPDPVFSTDGRTQLPYAATRADVAVDSRNLLWVATKTEDEVNVTAVTNEGFPRLNSTWTTSGWGSLEAMGIHHDQPVIGGTDASTPSRFKLARLTTMGQPDTTFAPGGVLTTEFPEAARVRSLQMDPAGRLLAGGRSGTGYALARYKGLRVTFSPPAGAQYDWRGRPAEYTFSRPVKGVGSGNVRLRRTDTDAQVAATPTCFARTGTVVSCRTGGVMKVQLAPTTPLAVGQEYRATINELGTAAPLVGWDGEALPARADTFRQGPSRRLFPPRVANSTAGGGSVRRMTEVGDGVQFVPPAGDSLKLYATKCPACTTLDVSVYYGVSGVIKTWRIYLYATTTTYNSEIVVPNYPGNSNVRYVRITNAGAAGGSRFDFDGWRIGAGSLNPEDQGGYFWRGGASRTAGAAVEFRFKGSTIQWKTQVGPDRGKARVLIDGVQHGELIDNYSASTAQVTKTIAGLPAGEHAFKLEVTGQRHASSRYAWVTSGQFTVLD